MTAVLGPGWELARPKYLREGSQARPNMEKNLERWIADAPRLECDDDSLRMTYRQSLVDLAALRFSPPVAKGKELAGGGAAVVHDDFRA